MRVLLRAADFGRHLELAIGADHAGLNAFDAGNLGARFEAQRLAVGGFLVGLARAHRYLEAGALKFDPHRLRGAHAPAGQRARRVHVADLAAVEQYAHPSVVKLGRVRGNERKQCEKAEPTQHGNVAGRHSALEYPTVMARVRT
ncbi:MAG: hypothetical protein QM741_17335 [Rudaea sp.]|uniref:hypothetical protein n=1 Tax=Rudaea sp. TaxID=2136325 RepID=UPI0039E492A2